MLSACVLMTISRQGLLFHTKAGLLDNIMYSGYYCVQLRLNSLTLKSVCVTVIIYIMRNCVALPQIPALTTYNYITLSVLLY